MFLKRFLWIPACAGLTGLAFAGSPVLPPSVLVLYDGPNVVDNPGRLDGLYLANLLGHFTTRRTVQSLDTYTPGMMAGYDAIFAIVFQKKYAVPKAVLADAAGRTGRFCWLGNQVGQLDQSNVLRKHGMAYVRMSDRIKYDRVFYKDHVIPKGDPETNILRVIDPQLAQVISWTAGPAVPREPYVLRSGNFWVFADSPFSYSGEVDRYVVLADLLHDILGIDHPENHQALARIEDLNAKSDPVAVRATMDVLYKFKIPFSFGFVPIYINPHERAEFRLTDKPDVLNILKRLVAIGGVPILHGYTHQYRGVTTDDYEFWDDLGDRPVRGDSETFAARRVEEAIKESMNVGLYPPIWETPHYAASPIDYRVFRRYFDTVFERRLVADRLGTDQLFPYPVIDMTGQFIIPESLSYVPIENPVIEPLLQAADALQVVRDGYAAFFFHPFLKPNLLERLIKGIQERGYRFADVRLFPNRVQMPGRVITNQEGNVRVAGRGRYLEEFILSPMGRVRHLRSIPVDPEKPVTRNVRLATGETYVATRQDVLPPSWLENLLKIAKGDVSVLHRRWEAVFAGRVQNDPLKAAILWNAKAKGPEAVDQASFNTVLTSFGFDMERVDYTGLMDEDLGPFSLLVIPQAAARTFDDDDIQKVMGAIERGITLVTDGDNPLSRALGIRLGEEFPVYNLRDHLFTDVDTRWPGKPSVRWVSEPPAEELQVYYSERDNGRPLVVGGNRGEGRFLYYAPLFDPESGQGYARFPNLPQLLINELRLNPMIKRRGADVYFDPGYRPSISIEALAKMWKLFGIRAVHVGAWHFYEKYTYDYARLVKVAHQNGILAYAWFEWPHVSQRFWEHHPTWREKTGTLVDAHLDWRYHMNFQNPDCLKAIMSDASKFLTAYDWDGINLGEFTFESPSGPARPDAMTPFNDQARQDFEKQAGFDPVELFRPSSSHFWRNAPNDLRAFFQYRKQVNEALTRTVLGEFRKIRQRQNRDWEVIVTLLDGLQHPELQDFLGFDFDRIINLINRQGATLQAEDPAADWTKAPDRYVQMGDRYAQLKLKKPFMIDINVLPVHPSNQSGFATAKPTGSEMFSLWQSASQYAARVCLYAESTINEQDWEVLTYGMAARGLVRKENDEIVVRAPYTVQVELGREARRVHLDGDPWFCVDKGNVWVPAGEHRISFARVQRSWFDRSKLDTHLLSLSGELLGSRRAPRGLEIEYQSSQRCALVFDKQPLYVEVDGETKRLPALKGDDGYTIMAPTGQHHLRVLTESPLLYWVQFASLVSASLIVLFGIASSSLLAFLFLFVRLHRRTFRFRKALQRYWTR